MSDQLITAIIITKNEFEHIKACIDSLAFCDQVLVLDSGSVDGTVDAAKQGGAEVHQREFDNYANQKNHAVTLAKHQWVLSIDADERVSEELQASILDQVKCSQNLNAFFMRRLNILFGHKHRFGGNQDDWPIRLFKKNSGNFVGQIHEVWKIDGDVGKLTGELIHHSTPNMKTYMHKLNQYTTLEAAQVDKTPDLRIRDLWIKPFGRFLQKYFCKFGLFDGKAGFRLAFMSAYYEFVSHIKLWNRK
jgi:glycosyltransferase involved in cell wall biosynthesis